MASRARTTRLAQGTCAFRAPQRYVTALAMRAGEVPLSVTLDAPAQAEAQLVLGCSATRDGEFSALSAVLCVAFSGGTRTVALGQAVALSAPYLTLICVGGLVPRVQVTALLSALALPPALAPPPLPLLLAPLRAADGALLPVSRHARPGHHYAQQSAGLRTTAYRVQVTELDGSPQALVAGALRVLEQPEALLVTSAPRYETATGEWVGFTLSVTELGAGADAEDVVVSFALEGLRGPRQGFVAEMRVLPALGTQRLCLLAPVRLVEPQAAAYRAGTTRAQFVRFRPALPDLYALGAGAGLPVARDDDDSFICRSAASLAEGRRTLAPQALRPAERALDELSTQLTVLFEAAPTPPRLLSGLVIDAPATDALGVYDEASGAPVPFESARVGEHTQLVVGAGVARLLVLCYAASAPSYGAFVRGDDGLYDAVDAAGLPLFLEDLEPWMLDPAPRHARGLGTWLRPTAPGTFADPAPPAANSPLRYRAVGATGPLSVDGPTVRAEGALAVRVAQRFALEAPQAYRGFYRLRVHVPLLRHDGRSVLESGLLAPSPLQFALPVPSAPTALRCFRDAAPPELPCALARGVTCAALELFLVDELDGTLRDAATRGAVSVSVSASSPGSTVGGAAWAQRTVDGAPVWHVRLTGVVPGAEPELSLAVSAPASVADPRYAEAPAYAPSSTVRVPVLAAAAPALAAAVVDALTGRAFPTLCNGRRAEVTLTLPDGLFFAPWLLGADATGLLVTATFQGLSTATFALPAEADDADGVVVPIDSRRLTVRYAAPERARVGGVYGTVLFAVAAALVVERAGALYRAPYASVAASVACGPPPASTTLELQADGLVHLVARAADGTALAASGAVVRGLAPGGGHWLDGGAVSATLEAVACAEGGYVAEPVQLPVYGACASVAVTAAVMSARAEARVEFRFVDELRGQTLAPVVAAKSFAARVGAATLAMAVEGETLVALASELLAFSDGGPVTVAFPGLVVGNAAGRRSAARDATVAVLSLDPLAVEPAPLRLDVAEGAAVGQLALAFPARTRVLVRGTAALVDAADAVHASGPVLRAAAGGYVVPLGRTGTAEPPPNEPLQLRLRDFYGRTPDGALYAAAESAPFVREPGPRAASARLVGAYAGPQRGARFEVLDDAGLPLPVLGVERVEVDGAAVAATVGPGHVAFASPQPVAALTLHGVRLAGAAAGVTERTLRAFEHRLVGPFATASTGLQAALQQPRAALWQTAGAQLAYYVLVDGLGRPLPATGPSGLATALRPPYARPADLAPASAGWAAASGLVLATCTGLGGVADGGGRKYDAAATFRAESSPTLAVPVGEHGLTAAFAARVAAALPRVGGPCDMGAGPHRAVAGGPVGGATVATDLQVLSGSARLDATFRYATTGACRLALALVGLAGATYTLAYTLAGERAALTIVVAADGAASLGTAAAPLALAASASTTCRPGPVPVVASLAAPTAMLASAPVAAAYADALGLFVVRGDATAPFTLRYLGPAGALVTLTATADAAFGDVGSEASPLRLPAVDSALKCGAGAVRVVAALPVAAALTASPRQALPLAAPLVLPARAYALETPLVPGLYTLASASREGERAALEVVGPSPASAQATVAWPVTPDAGRAAQLALTMAPDYACVAAAVVDAGSGFLAGARVSVLGLSLTLGAADVATAARTVAVATPSFAALPVPRALFVGLLGAGSALASPALRRGAGTALVVMQPGAECASATATGASVLALAPLAPLGGGRYGVGYAGATGSVQLALQSVAMRGAAAGDVAAAALPTVAPPGPAVYVGPDRAADAHTAVVSLGAALRGSRGVACVGEVELDGQRRVSTAEHDAPELVVGTGDALTVSGLGPAELVDARGRIVRRFGASPAALPATLAPGAYALRKRRTGATLPLLVSGPACPSATTLAVPAAGLTLADALALDGGCAATLVVPPYPLGGLRSAWDPAQTLDLALGPLVAGQAAEAYAYALSCADQPLAAAAGTGTLVALDAAGATLASAAVTVGAASLGLPAIPSLAESVVLRLQQPVQQRGVAGTTAVDATFARPVVAPPTAYAVAFSASAAALDAPYAQLLGPLRAQWASPTPNAAEVAVVLDRPVVASRYALRTAPALARPAGAGTVAATVAFRVEDARGATVPATLVSVRLDGREVVGGAVELARHSVLRADVLVDGTPHALFLGEEPLTLAVGGTLLVAEPTRGRVVRFGAEPGVSGTLAFALGAATIAVPDAQRCGLACAPAASLEGTHEVLAIALLSDVTATWTCADAPPRQGSVLAVQLASASKGPLACSAALAPWAASVASGLELTVPELAAPVAFVELGGLGLSAGGTRYASVPVPLGVAGVAYLGLPRYEWQPRGACGLTAGAEHEGLRVDLVGVPLPGTLLVRDAAGTLLGAAPVDAAGAVATLALGGAAGAARASLASGPGEWPLGAVTLKAPLGAVGALAVASARTATQYALAGSYARVRLEGAPTTTVDGTVRRDVASPSWDFYDATDVAAGAAATVPLRIFAVDAAGASTPAGGLVHALQLRRGLRLTIDPAQHAALDAPAAWHCALLASEDALDAVQGVRVAFDDGSTADAAARLVDARRVLVLVGSSAAPRRVASFAVSASLQGDAARTAVVYPAAELVLASPAGGYALGAVVRLDAPAGTVAGIAPPFGVGLVAGRLALAVAGAWYVADAPAPLGTHALAAVVRGATCYAVLGDASYAMQSGPAPAPGACGTALRVARGPLEPCGWDRLVGFARAVAAGSAPLPRPPRQALPETLPALRCARSLAAGAALLDHAPPIRAVAASGPAGTVAAALDGDVWRVGAACDVACALVTLDGEAGEAGEAVTLWRELPDYELALCAGDPASAARDLPAGAWALVPDGLAPTAAVLDGGDAADVASGLVTLGAGSAAAAVAAAAVEPGTGRGLAFCASAALLAPPRVYRVPAGAALGAYGLTAHAEGAFVRGVENLVYFSGLAEASPWHTSAVASVAASAAVACTTLRVDRAPFGALVRLAAHAGATLRCTLQLTGPDGVALRAAAADLAAAAPARVGLDAGAAPLDGSAAVPAPAERPTSSLTVSALAVLAPSTQREASAGLALVSAALGVRIESTGTELRVTVPTSAGARVAVYALPELDDGLRAVTVHVQQQLATVWVAIDGDARECPLAGRVQLPSASASFALALAPGPSGEAPRAAVAGVWVQCNAADPRPMHAAVRAEAPARQAPAPQYAPTYHGTQWPDASGATSTAPTAAPSTLRPAGAWVEQRTDCGAAPAAMRRVRVGAAGPASVALLGSDDGAAWDEVARWDVAGSAVLDAPQGRPYRRHAVRVVGAWRVDSELARPRPRLLLSVLSPTQVFVSLRHGPYSAAPAGSLSLATYAGGPAALGAGAAQRLGGLDGAAYAAPAGLCAPLLVLGAGAHTVAAEPSYVGVTRATLTPYAATVVAVRAAVAAEPATVLQFGDWALEAGGGALRARASDGALLGTAPLAAGVHELLVRRDKGVRVFVNEVQALAFADRALALSAVGDAAGVLRVASLRIAAAAQGATVQAYSPAACAPLAAADDSPVCSAGGLPGLEATYGAGPMPAYVSRPALAAARRFSAVRLAGASTPVEFVVTQAGSANLAGRLSTVPPSTIVYAADGASATATALYGAGFAALEVLCDGAAAAVAPAPVFYSPSTVALGAATGPLAPFALSTSATAVTLAVPVLGGVEWKRAEQGSHTNAVVTAASVAGAALSVTARAASYGACVLRLTLVGPDDGTVALQLALDRVLHLPGPAQAIVPSRPSVGSTCTAQCTFDFGAFPAGYAADVRAVVGGTLLGAASLRLEWPSQPVPSATPTFTVDVRAVALALRLYTLSWSTSVTYSPGTVAVGPMQNLSGLPSALLLATKTDALFLRVRCAITGLPAGAILRSASAADGFALLPGSCLLAADRESVELRLVPTRVPAAACPAATLQLVGPDAVAFALTVTAQVADVCALPWGDDAEVSTASDACGVAGSPVECAWVFGRLALMTQCAFAVEAPWALSVDAAAGVVRATCTPSAAGTLQVTLVASLTGLSAAVTRRFAATVAVRDLVPSALPGCVRRMLWRDGTMSGELATQVETYTNLVAQEGSYRRMTFDKARFTGQSPYFALFLSVDLSQLEASGQTVLYGQGFRSDTSPNYYIGPPAYTDPAVAVFDRPGGRLLGVFENSSGWEGTGGDGACIPVPRAASAAVAQFAYCSSSGGSAGSYIARLGGARVAVRNAWECGPQSTDDQKRRVLDYWLHKAVKSATFFTSGAPITLGGYWAAGAWPASPLWPAGSAPARPAYATLGAAWATADAHAAWVRTVFDCSLLRLFAAGQAVPGCSAQVDAASSVPLALNAPQGATGLGLLGSGWWLRWGYQQPQMASRIALGASSALPGVGVELRGYASRAFASPTLLATVTSFGTGGTVKWAPLALGAFTHYELRQSAGATDPCTLWVGLGE
jgi:hypothetical protein